VTAPSSSVANALVGLFAAASSTISRKTLGFWRRIVVSFEAITRIQFENRNASPRVRRSAGRYRRTDDAAQSFRLASSKRLAFLQPDSPVHPVNHATGESLAHVCRSYAAVGESHCAFQSVPTEGVGAERLERKTPPRSLLWRRAPINRRRAFALNRPGREIGHAIWTRQHMAKSALVVAGIGGRVVIPGDGSNRLDAGVDVRIRYSSRFRMCSVEYSDRRAPGGWSLASLSFSCARSSWPGLCESRFENRCSAATELRQKRLQAVLDGLIRPDPLRESLGRHPQRRPLA